MEMETKEQDGITVSQIFEECRNLSPQERSNICQEYEDDVKALATSMGNLYQEHAGVLMMYGVRVEVKFYAFNDPVFQTNLGSEDFYKKFVENRLKEHENDERAKTGN